MARTEKSKFSALKPFFVTMQKINKTKRNNLKSNAFDQMLAEEMFSIKQHLSDMDMSDPSPVTKITKSHLQTPTLEIKQKWAVIESMARSNVIENVIKKSDKSDEIRPDATQTVINLPVGNTKQDLVAEPSKIAIRDERTVSKQSGNKKNIGLRSLEEHDHNLSDKSTRHPKTCTCMRHNSQTTCTHRCTQNSYFMQFDENSSSHECTHNYECTHTHDCSSTYDCTTAHECPSTHECHSPKDCCTSHLNYPEKSTICPVMYTFTTDLDTFIPPLAYPGYQGYYIPQPYFIADKTDKPRKKKTKKHKRRKTTPCNDDLYYDGNSKYSDDDYLEYDSTTKTKMRLKESTSKIDYVEKQPENDENNVKQDGCMYEANKDKFVNEIVDDLRTHYSDSVIKHCYCSSSSQHKILPTVFACCVCVLYTLVYNFI